MQKILIQFDTDPQPSSFDRVVAIDSGVDQLFSYSGITPENVTGLVHGAIFTRGPADLKNTAIFVGGSHADSGEKLMKAIGSTFFGPMRVSVMMDSNGCNTTAAAAIASARRHIDLRGVRAVVLGATGPVGLRAAELLALEGASVTLVSRTQQRADDACRSIASRVELSELTGVAAATQEEFVAVCRDSTIVVAAGAAGVCFLPEGTIGQLPGLKLAIDLNAVPPLGIADVAVNAKAAEKNGCVCYGALGVGGLKMKVHRASVASLFETNDRIVGTREIYAL
ncbi:MAG: bifunctional NADP-dependent methylenetetrahydromethanopterin dehydrogenase/methylenetetrahydrofolate dehydrogenase, partial [Planctomycetaceae bacterium]|nr:bifunctional NADP-dependent methylenetetrahydromethanopterin dehydrogenase/methylenetetrahydrofolate dehydrogenase [Planctomycetaceae bacterium]